MFVTNRRGSCGLFGRILNRNVLPHGDGVSVSGDHVIAKLGDLVGIDVDDVLGRLESRDYKSIQ